MECGDSATHYLWDEDGMVLVMRMGRGIKRQEFEVCDFDVRQRTIFWLQPDIYEPILFDNSRINAEAGLD